MLERARTAVCSLSLLLAAGCSHPTNVTPTLASPAATQAVIGLQAPPAGRARLLVFNSGRIDGEYRPRSYGVRLFLNGEPVGGVNANEAMAIDVAPGRYTLHWTELGGKALMHKLEPGTFDVRSSELLVLQTDFDNWVLKMGKGFRPGQTTTVAGREQVDPNIEIVRPSNCSPALCLPD